MLKKCNNETFIPNERTKHCKSDKEIKEVMSLSNTFFTLAFVNSYFDGSDYNQSIKYYVDDKYYWFMDDNNLKLSDFYLQQNEANLQENYITDLFNDPKIIQTIKMDHYRELISASD
jgi:hypothetical protein